MRARLLLLFVCILGSTFFVGCGGGGPAPANITGEVKVDGVPVVKGVIAFAPADSTGVPVTVDITNGTYFARTTAGPKQVQISAPIVVSKQKESPAPDAPWIEVTRESLPANYNSKSELTFEMQPGANTKNWDLTTKKK